MSGALPGALSSKYLYSLNINPRAVAGGATGTSVSLGSPQLEPADGREAMGLVIDALIARAQDPEQVERLLPYVARFMEDYTNEEGSKNASYRATDKAGQMIEMAMVEKAPEMYRQLRASGQLKRVLDERTSQAFQTWEELYSQAQTPILQGQGEYLENVRALFVKHVVTLKSFSFDYGIAPLITAALSPRSEATNHRFRSWAERMAAFGASRVR